MLASSGLEFLYLLTRIRENIDRLTVLPQERNLLEERLEAADRITRRQQSGVSISSQNEFYELDRLLSNSGHAEEKVNDMIGILMMTNGEFASFIRQASRHFANSITGTLDVVLGRHHQDEAPFRGCPGIPGGHERAIYGLAAQRRNHHRKLYGRGSSLPQSKSSELSAEYPI